MSATIFSFLTRNILLGFSHSKKYMVNFEVISMNGIRTVHPPVGFDLLP